MSIPQEVLDDLKAPTVGEGQTVAQAIQAEVTGVMYWAHLQAIPVDEQELRDELKRLMSDQDAQTKMPPTPPSQKQSSTSNS